VRLEWSLKVPVAVYPTPPWVVIWEVAVEGVTETLVSVGWPAPQPSSRNRPASTGKMESFKWFFIAFALQFRCCLSHTCRDTSPRQWGAGLLRSETLVSS